MKKKETKTKKITIDTLAIMMNNSFSRLEDRMTGMATKDDIKNMATKDDIEMLKTKIEGVDKRIDDLAETKVSKIAYKELEHRVDVIEKSL